MEPVSGVSRPAMMRSRVVLPQPDGPSKATSSPLWMSRLMSFSARKAPNCLWTLRISMLTGLFLRAAVALAVDSRFAPLLEQQNDQGQGQQQAGHAERRDVVVFVVENFDMQRQGIGHPADMPGHHRHGAELAHRTRGTEYHAINQPPADI